MELQDFYLQIKSRLANRFLVLLHVDLTSLFPFAKLDAYPRITLPVVIATRDYTPLAIIADDAYIQSQGVSDDLLLQLHTLIRQEGAALYSSEHACELSDIELDRELDTLSAENANRHLNVEQQAAHQEKEPANASKPKKRSVLVPTLVVLALAGAYMGYKHNSSSASAPQFNLDPNAAAVLATATPNSPSNENAAADIQRRIDESKRRACTNPPENGHVVGYPSDLKPNGKAYWVINNTTPLHVLASATYHGKKVADVYVAPHAHASVAVAPYTYLYTISATDKWCSMYVMSNPMGYSPRSTSNGQMPSSFADGKLATTLVALDRGSLDTSIEVADVEH